MITQIYIYIYIYMYVCMYVCVCVFSFVWGISMIVDYLMSNPFNTYTLDK